MQVLITAVLQLNFLVFYNMKQLFVKVVLNLLFTVPARNVPE